MFVFDLFDDKDKKTKSKQRNIQNKGDIYYQTNDPYVRAGLERAHREHPTAKNDTEAMIGHVARQDELIRNQARMLKQQEQENEKQSKQINDLVKSTQEKEKRFQDLTDLVKDQGLTPQQGAEMAKELEKDTTGTLQPSQITVPQKKTAPAQGARLRTVTVPTAAQTKIAEPAKPQPGASVQQIAQYNKDQEKLQTTPPAATAATTEPTTKTDTEQPAKFAPTSADIFNLNDYRPKELKKAAESRIAEQADPGSLAFQQMAQTAVDIPARQKEIIKQADKEKNEDQFKIAFVTGKTVQLQFGPAHVTLTPEDAARIWEVVLVRYGKTPEARQVFDNIFSDLNAFRQMKQYVDELQQSLPISEGEVIRLANSPKTPDELKAYTLALEIMKAARNPQVPTEKIDQMKQFLFKDYQARIQQAPDGSFYLNRNGVKSRLPDPTTFSLEEEPHDGKNSWSDGQGQWSSENNLISSGNNPMGFRENYDDADEFGMPGSEFFPDEEDDRLKDGDYVRDRQDGESGEIFRMSGDPSERRVRILDRDGRGWYISPERLVAVDRNDPDIMKYFSKQRQRVSSLDEGKVKELYYNLRNMSEKEFETKYQMSKARAQQVYGSVLKPAPQQDVPVQENYWNKLQEERRRKAYSYLNELETLFKDVK